MDEQSKEATNARRQNLLTLFAKNYSGQITGVALSALSAWMIVTGLKDAAGFEITRQSALADLCGIALLVGVAHWIRAKYKVK